MHSFSSRSQKCLIFFVLCSQPLHFVCLMSLSVFSFLVGAGAKSLLPSKMDFKSNCSRNSHWIILIVSTLIPISVFAVFHSFNIYQEFITYQGRLWAEKYKVNRWTDYENGAFRSDGQAKDSSKKVSVGYQKVIIYEAKEGKSPGIGRVSANGQWVQRT